jgi:hypothetical protein
VAEALIIDLATELRERRPDAQAKVKSVVISRRSVMKKILLLLVLVALGAVVAKKVRGA